MATKHRIDWVDSARGIGIVLVVVGHVIRGLMKAQIAPSDSWEAGVDSYVYSFHMPLFFWLSGLFAPRKLRRSWGQLLPDLAATILYPYLLWGALQTLIQIGLSNYTNSPATFASLLQIPIAPPMQFWFLYVLFIVTLVHRAISSLFSLKIALLVCVALSVGRSYLPGEIWGIVSITLWYLPYYALGSLMLEQTSHLVHRMPQAIRLVSALGCLGSVALLVNTPANGVATALLGSAGCVLLASALSELTPTRFLEKLGRASLQIYVAHTLASAGVRLGLLWLGVREPWVHFLFGSLAGIAFPLLLANLVQSRGIPFVFSWPRAKSSP